MLRGGGELRAMSVFRRVFLSGVQECRSDATLSSVDECAACIYLERRDAETQRFSFIEHGLHGLHECLLGIMHINGISVAGTHVSVQK